MVKARASSFALAASMACVVLASCTGKVSPMDVADPRPAHHVVDTSGTLDAPELEAIDAAAAGASSDGELLVVVVDSTGGVEPRQWATMVFNRLRLDTKERNRGVLFMAAVKDRKSEIVVGDGFPGGVTNITDDIMQNVVVAHFKSGDPKRAMVEGARAIATRVIPLPVPEAPLASDVPPRAPTSAEVIAAIATAGPSVAALVDPRPASVVLDGARALTPMDVHKLDSMANVQISGGIDPLFVVVKDTGASPARAFALALFERWLAPSARQRGVLVLAIAGDKTVEVVAGPGFSSETASPIEELTREANARIASEGAGPALQRVARQLSDLGMGLDMSDSARAREALESRARAEAVQTFVPYTPAPSMLDGVGEDERFWLGVIGGAGVLGVGGLGVREVLRRRPRSCGKCNVRMHRLAEDLDDKHLKDGEKAEERLRSVDYDVWACGTCGSVLKTRWGAIFSSYAKCTSCSWKTMTSTSRTITSATTSSTGLAEVTEDCKHCSHHRTSTRVIPMVTKSSSSGSSSGGGGGGYSSGRGSSGSW